MDGPYTPCKRASSLPPSSPLSELSSSPLLTPILPPLSSDDLIFSSPITGNRQERTVKARAKGHRKRAQTFQHRKEQSQLQALDLAAARKEKEECALQEKHHFFDSVLNELKMRGQTLGDLLLYVSDPIYKHGISRWDMFRVKGWVPKILDLWVNESSPTSRQQVHCWAVDYVSSEVKREAKNLTSSGFLQTLHKPINASLILSFSMSNIQSHFQKHASVLMNVLSSMATSKRQIKEASPQRFVKKMVVVTSSALALLGEYSYSNNWAKKAISLYLYSSGSQRQPLSVIAHLGLGESYYSIVSKKRKRRVKKGPEPHGPAVDTPTPTHSTPKTDLRAGSLRELSNSMVDMARAIASTGMFATSYDNINMVFKAAEQIVGRTDAQENGTCATIWPLFKATAQNMQISDLEHSFKHSKTLSIHDILLSLQEAESLSCHLRHCILRIIITHGGNGFNRFKSDLGNTMPTTEHKIEVHQTPLHPLPAFNIDESTIVGGAAVVDSIFEVLHSKVTKGWLKLVKFFCGDQLTIARLRALLNIRAGHEGGYSGFSWGVWMPGLFHAKMADIHGCFLLHWGKAAAGPRNPGCLAFHNTILQRKPIVPSSLPPFRTCRDLIFLSLYARVLHCLLLVSKTTSLDEYLSCPSLSWKVLEEHAQQILDQFANPDVVATLRWERTRQMFETSSTMPLASTDTTPPTTATSKSNGDMVFENAVLFLRDALLSREFTDAIKIGDSGRVMLVLKMWALSFRGNGRTKYAHEMLHLIHNVEHVWPKGIRDIVFNNWLVNPSGNANSWVEVDLMQEHMNFWIKNFYRAHGSAASWEWLEMIAPCVEVLRQLSRNFKQMLGSDVGTAHHPMDLSVDIPDLMDSLDEYEVYTFKKGRRLDDDDHPVQDAISSGLKSLLTGKENPLNDYNRSFLDLQARRQLTPLVGIEDANGTHTSAHRDPNPSPSHSHSPSAPQPLSPLTRVLVPLPVPFEPDLESPTLDDDEDVEETSEALPEHMQAFGDEFHEATLALETAADVSLDMDAEDHGGDSQTLFDEIRSQIDDWDGSESSGDEASNEEYPA